MKNFILTGFFALLFLCSLSINFTLLQRISESRSRIEYLERYIDVSEKIDSIIDKNNVVVFGENGSANE